MNGRAKTRTERLSLALTPMEKAQIETEAVRCGMTVTDLIVIRCCFPREVFDGPVRCDDTADQVGMDEELYGRGDSQGDQEEVPNDSSQDAVPERSGDVDSRSRELVEHRVLDIDGAKVKCCMRCYMLHGGPHKSCKTCLSLNQRKQ